MNQAPVDHVGGTQESGPWPEGVDEIVEGEQYDRIVTAEDGTEEVRTVTVTDVIQVADTDGYVITYRHGGGQ